MPTWPSLRRYEIQSEIGVGGMASVYRAIDTLSDREVALKVISRRDQLSLRDEFLALARIRHPNIVTVYDYGRTSEGLDFIAMELLEGPTLQQAAGDPESKSFVAAATGLLRGLAVVHARGLVHADIKPSNILLAEDIDDLANAVKLTDFGLAHAVSATSLGARGTIGYAAPEVYSSQIDARSDLYSLGVVLYELLCGTHPFPVTSLPVLLHAQRTAAFEPPQRRNPKLSSSWAEILCALLDPAPGARPQTADEVLQRVTSVSSGLESGDATPVIRAGSVFAGRLDELERLEALFRNVSDARGQVVFLTGEPGIGKTRLLDELALRLRLQGASIWQLDASLPRSLHRETDRDPIETESRYAMAAVMARELAELTRDGTVLMTIDNVEQTDALARDRISYLLRAAATQKVLAIVASPGVLPELEDTAHTSLGLIRLRGEELHALVASTFSSQLADVLAPHLDDRFAGNPGHINESLERMVQRGKVVRVRGQWKLHGDPRELPEVADSQQAAMDRFRSLAAPSRELLAAIAAMGPAGTIATATAALALIGLETDEDGVAQTLADGVIAHLVKTDPATGYYRFHDSRLPSLIQRTLDPAVAKAAHLASAAALAEVDQDLELERLRAAHLLAGGAPRAVALAVDIATKLRFHGNLAEAVELLQSASDRDRESAPAQFALAELVIEVGELDRAATLYQRCIDNARDPALRVQAQMGLARLERRRGNGDTAISLLMEALRLAREHGLRDEQIASHLLIGRVLLYRSDYKAATEHAVAGELLATQARDRRALANLNRLHAAIDTSIGESKRARGRLEEALREAKELGDTPLSARIRFELGRNAIHLADFGRAIELLEGALGELEKIGHVELAAGAHNNLGAAHYFRGEWTQARSCWEEFRARCVQINEKTEVVNALNNLGSLYRDLGELELALSTFDQAQRLARETRHEHMSAMIEANRGETLARRGDLPEAESSYRKALSTFRKIGASDDVIETQRRACQLALARNRPKEALDRAVDLIREARDANNRMEEAMLHLVSSEALRLTGDLESAQWFNSQARQQLEEIQARYQLAQAELEGACIAQAAGDADTARTLFDKAQSTFRDLGARWDLSRSRALRDRYEDSEAHLPGAGMDILRLVQHASDPDTDRYLQRMLDTLLKLTEFERGFILLLDDDGRPTERMRRSRTGEWRFEPDEAAFSGSIVRQVAATGEAQVIHDVEKDVDVRAQKSVIALGLRKILCAPLQAHGRTIGVVYVDSQTLSSAEDKDNLAVVKALATMAAVAVENGRLHREEQRKSELMAILAHEIRNPLSGILGYSELGLAKVEEGSQEADLFQRIRRDGGRLRRLVDNIMELTRHESGQTDWSFHPVDMPALVTEAISTHRPTALARNITLTQDVTDTPPPVLGNEDRLLQVLSNLIGNAIKFSPGGASVSVHCYVETVPISDPTAPPLAATTLAAWTPLGEERSQETTTSLRVDVVDNGPGMSEANRTRLFEKFAQAGSSRSRSKGIGLGLYISREIVHRHGGSIWVQSRLGEGSTFSFRLPLAS